MTRPEADAPARSRRAESFLTTLLKEAGWRVRRPRDGKAPPLLVERKGIAYAVCIKSAPEGRADRLVPLFAQALIEASGAARQEAAALAVVAAPRISSHAAERVMSFARRYAPDAGAGVIDFEGLAAFRGPHLEALSTRGEPPRALLRHPLPQAGQLFSDLNQWMLKVLLAPEIPEPWLAAPRGHYRNASELARAAKVSVMSAFRWQALSARSPREIPMRFLRPGDRDGQIRDLLRDERACLALFAAADALRIGSVSGAPTHVYVERLQPARLLSWKNLRSCAPHESPDVVVRQADAPQSVFRGRVSAEGRAACDVLQVWLDVASHPSRGREQAELIRRRLPGPVIP